MRHDKEFGTNIELSNRCLTPIKDAPNMQGVILGKGIDPHGILEAIIKKGTHVHGEDNRVQYYARMGEGKDGERCVMNRLNHGSSDNSYRFRTVEPKVFHIGDMVQVEVTFIAVSLKGGKQKLKAILRTVALLNNTFAKVSNDRWRHRKTYSDGIFSLRTQ